MQMVNVGFGSIVAGHRIIALVHPASAPIKRLVQEAKKRFMLIDATCGRRTRAVIVTDSDHVILSAVQPETIAHRLYALGQEQDKAAPSMDDTDREALEAVFDEDEPEEDE